jgi:O-antigen/teichoic acid export membrane protein
VFAAVALLTVHRFGIVAVPLAQAVQGSCVFILAVPILYRELPEMRLARPTFASFKHIWVYGAHLQLITLLVLLYDPATRLLLNHFGSLSAVGNFDLANRLIGQVRSLIVSANQVMVPHYANVNIANPEMVAPTVRANFQILLVASTIVFSMLSVSSFLIGDLWIGHNHAGFIEACMILIIGHFVNSLSVGIYFMNMGVGAALNNVNMWIVIISVNVVGGIFGGLFAGVRGVLLSVSAALVCGSFVGFADYFRAYNVSIRTLGSTTALKFAVVGAIVFTVSALTAVTGLPVGDGPITSLLPIILGSSVWVYFVWREALIAGQSPLFWARATIASFRF